MSHSKNLSYIVEIEYEGTHEDDKSCPRYEFYKKHFENYRVAYDFYNVLYDLHNDLEYLPGILVDELKSVFPEAEVLPNASLTTINFQTYNKEENRIESTESWSW